MWHIISKQIIFGYNRAPRENFFCKKQLFKNKDSMTILISFDIDIDEILKKISIRSIISIIAPLFSLPQNPEFKIWETTPLVQIFLSFQFLKKIITTIFIHMDTHRILLDLLFHEKEDLRHLLDTSILPNI